jgi:hypothetical protein
VRTLARPGWILVHAAVVLLVIGFLLLGWWQIGRAVSGNLLSFGYAVEWPAFAAFTVYVWVKEMRRAVRQEPAEPVVREPVRGRPRDGAAYDDSDDDQLAAYNRYLAWLNANPHASRSQYPG